MLAAGSSAAGRKFSDNEHTRQLLAFVDPKMEHVDEWAFRWAGLEGEEDRRMLETMANVSLWTIK